MRASVLSRRVAPAVAAVAMLGSLLTGGGSAYAASVAPASPGLATAMHCGHGCDDWDDDYYDYGYYRHRHHHWDDDLYRYPDCDRYGNGYGCPEYGYPPQR